MNGPQSLGGSPVHVFLYVEDADAVTEAIAAGATELMPVENSEDGDRRGGVTDPFGHVWYIGTYRRHLPRGTPETVRRLCRPVTFRRRGQRTKKRQYVDAHQLVTSDSRRPGDRTTGAPNVNATGRAPRRRPGCAAAELERVLGVVGGP